MVKVRLKLHHSKKPFCLMCAETNLNFKVKVQDIVLKVRKVHNSSRAYLRITSALKEDKAKYPVRCVVIKSYGMSAGSMSRSVDHVFHDLIPQRVVIGMVDNHAFNGAFRKNPFNFQSYKMALSGLLKIMTPFQTDLIKPILQQMEVGNTLQHSSPAAMIMEMQ